MEQEEEKEIYNLFQKIIRDSIPVKITPIVTQLLVAVIFIFYGVTAENPLLTDKAIAWFSFVPALMFVPLEIYRYVTHIFLHANFTHLVTNMAFLWCFGDNVEEKVGKTIYVLSFFISGILAALGFGLFVLSLFPAYAIVPCIGASGAISGIMGMYFVLIPENKLIVLDKYEVDSRYFLILWFLSQLYYVFQMEMGVAFFAHVVGFIVGVIIGYAAGKRE